MLPAYDIETTNLGREAFATTWQRQRDWVDAIAAGGPQRVVLVEHDHVITLGRGTDAKNVLSDALPIVQIERGGDATYHGPGQMVAYPLLRLAEHGLGIHSYLRLLEAALVDTCRAFGVETIPIPKKTGVWTADGNRKIASIGIAVRQGVSYHGVALNVSTDLKMFEPINPCGFDASVMTSIERETSHSQRVGDVADTFARSLTHRLAVLEAEPPA